MRAALYQTDWGFVGAAYEEQEISALILPRSSPEAVMEELVQLAGHPLPLSLIGQDLRRLLDAYFAGQETEWKLKVDLSWASEFQKEVLMAIREIPYGEVRSYAWVARAIGRPGASRAVGRALGANRLPLIFPCHRVIRQDGDLGGFSGGAGLKERLLNLEGAYPFMARSN